MVRAKSSIHVRVSNLAALRPFPPTSARGELTDGLSPVLAERPLREATSTDIKHSL